MKKMMTLEARTCLNVTNRESTHTKRFVYSIASQHYSRGNKKEKRINVVVSMMVLMVLYVGYGW
jgi:hypothetical protein